MGAHNLALVTLLVAAVSISSCQTTGGAKSGSGYDFQALSGVKEAMVYNGVLSLPAMDNIAVPSFSSIVLVPGFRYYYLVYKALTDPPTQRRVHSKALEVIREMGYCQGAESSHCTDTAGFYENHMATWARVVLETSAIGEMAKFIKKGRYAVSAHGYHTRVSIDASQYGMGPDYDGAIIQPVLRTYKWCPESATRRCQLFIDTAGLAGKVMSEDNVRPIANMPRTAPLHIDIGPSVRSRNAIASLNGPDPYHPKIDPPSIKPSRSECTLCGSEHSWANSDKPCAILQCFVTGPHRNGSPAEFCVPNGLRTHTADELCQQHIHLEEYLTHSSLLGSGDYVSQPESSGSLEMLVSATVVACFGFPACALSLATIVVWRKRKASARSKAAQIGDGTAAREGAEPLLNQENGSGGVVRDWGDLVVEDGVEYRPPLVTVAVDIESDGYESSPRSAPRRRLSSVSSDRHLEALPMLEEGDS